MGIIQLASVIGKILMWFLSRKPPIQEEQFSEDIKELDKALAASDADNISLLFHRMRLEGHSSHPEGQDDNADGQR